MLKLRKSLQTGNIWLASVALLASAFMPLALPSRATALSGLTVAQISNTVRASNGVAALSWNSALASSASAKAADMCAKGYWSHTAPDGATAWTFMRQAGYSYTTAAENLSRGYVDPGAVVSGWMASTGHRANLLSASFADTGVGSASCVFEGVQTTFVVAHYGASGTVRKAAPAPAPAPAAKPAPKAAAQPTKTVSAPQAAAAAPPLPEVKPVAPKRCFGSKVWQNTMDRLHTNLLSELRASGRQNPTPQSACPQ